MATTSRAKHQANPTPQPPTKERLAVPYPYTPILTTLYHLLTMQRAHGSLGEARTLTMLHDTHILRTQEDHFIDGAGNLHCLIPLPSGAPSRTMFTAHTDTCHSNTGAEANPVEFEPDTPHIWRSGRGRRLCLGADDGAGVAMLCHLLAHGVPGHYVFFRGEECGGIGSRWLASAMPDLFKGIDRAIAFDRAGYSDVITHQSGGRCCSDEFAQALATALTPEDFSLAFMPCDTGVYTDTAEFVNLVPECSNVSIFYADQHGDRESIDTDALVRLSHQVLTVDWENLPTKRDFKAFDRYWESEDTTFYPPRRISPSRWPLPEEGSAEATLMALCFDAAKTGSQTELKEMIAQIVCPEDPQMAVRNMRLPIPTGVIDATYADLVEGKDVYTAAFDLCESCTD